MRKRLEESTASKPKYTTSGYAYFDVRGVVQKVKEYPKGKCDYVTFKVDQGDKYSEVYQDVSVKIPWDLNVRLDEGDKVLISGPIKSFWLKDIGRVLLECVAETIEDLSGEVTMPRTEPSDETPFE